MKSFKEHCCNECVDQYVDIIEAAEYKGRKVK